MQQRIVAALTAALAIGCSCQKRPATGDAVILARITVEPAVKATCVVLEVRALGAAVLSDRRLDRLAGKAEYLVAVYQQSLPSEIALQARGLWGTGCADPLSPNAASPEKRESFAVGEVREVVLDLRTPPPTEDLDRDGYRAATNGGPDCDDANASIHPGVEEDCAGAFDRNCDGQIGCADPACAGAGCGATAVCCNGSCVQEVCDNGADDDCDGKADCADATCQGLAGPEILCGDGRNNDCDANGDCADADCNLKSCAAGKLCEFASRSCSLTCTPTQSPENTCNDGVDNDCNTQTDCDDAACDNDPCAPFGKRCLGRACVCPTGASPETRCDNSLDDDCDGQADCPDGDCVGRTCSAGKNCSAAGGCEDIETACGDGLDNDGDGRADCDDRDCAARPCDDKNVCTTGETCQGPTCTGGAPPVCSSAPLCHTAPGSCDAGACAYPQAGNGTPCATDLCTTPNTCQAGVCQAAPVTCTSPLLCHASPGSCDAGACVYPQASNGTPCATDLCTTPNTCQGGACQASPVTCTSPPAQCRTSPGTCGAADGGCFYGLASAGTPCDAGTCNDAGVCVAPPSAFPYTPSNWSPSAISAPSGLAVNVTGNATYDSATDTFANWGAVQPVSHPAPQTGGPAVLILAMNSLTVGSAGSITISGDRPVIFAVYGDATLQGWVTARGLAGTAGPGGGLGGLCGLSTGQDGSRNGDNGGGGGGAGFGRDGQDGGNGADGGPKGVKGVTSTAPGPTLVPLRGGCNGGRGGRSNAVFGGPGGGGGGAIQISVAGVLRLESVVSASGGGGRGGQRRDGGGGGGSGGAVLLEGATVVVTPTARLTANGGAGGEAGSDDGTAGIPGSDGPADSSAQAAGGSGASNSGGDGGHGGSALGDPTAGQDGVSNKGGGGGGGGGVGRIRINASSGCTVSGTPVYSPMPTSTGANCP